VEKRVYYGGKVCGKIKCLFPSRPSVLEQIQKQQRFVQIYSISVAVEFDQLKGRKPCETKAWLKVYIP
jgi:hypothetical protein